MCSDASLRGHQSRRWTPSQNAVCRNGQLYTFNGQCKDERWQDLKADMETAAKSFHILGSRTSLPGWGSRL